MQADQGSNRQLEHSSEQAKPSHASAPTCHAAVTRLSQVGSASRMAEQAAAALAPPSSALPSTGAAHSAFTACSRSSRVGKANRAEAPAQKGGAARACPSGPSADGSAKNTCATMQGRVATADERNMCPASSAPTSSLPRCSQADSSWSALTSRARSRREERRRAAAATAESGWLLTAASPLMGCSGWKYSRWSVSSRRPGSRTSAPCRRPEVNGRAKWRSGTSRTTAV